jgi:hypothetical protein
MAYEKSTVEVFEKKLKAGGYPGVAGARRGVGRMTEWSDADRERAHKAINKHFGAEATTKTSSPKAAKGKKRGRPAAAAAPATPAAPKRRGPPPKAAKAKAVKATAPAPAAGKKRGRPATIAAPATKKATRKATKSNPATPPTERMDLVERQVNVVRTVVATLGQCKELSGDTTSIVASARRATEALSIIVEDLYKIGRTQPVTDVSEAKQAHFFEQAVQASQKGNQIPVAPAAPPVAVPPPVIPPPAS